ncbi:hypothetical protein Pmar_PMAR005898 [Perkinsus marinus ATCC 50983]|uniref:Uncharacterized protein n=1 Tax=Perkinsus marinus (strain ATCC 50983 / TXsc) TaxID=423536 RepID=C5LKZ3_PERM5|nr:hypothetical protein Pmar_PMAR005898 [Perkinsus marinus ATCC 50983]EER02557.1 hypothetical protein Pmar_PMAR005898 [Perkinsus marinus ATCC 50983]|eukprot:XP_002769839.1 hypothetical protein Pmar_PMAR005898 [Perkinsus marinus ATCC 50983]
MPSTVAPTPTPSPSPPLVVIDKGCTTSFYIWWSKTWIVSSSSHEHKKEYSTLYINLWRGTSMSVIRAALLTASQIISYTTLKTYITNKRDSIHMPYINDPTATIPHDRRRISIEVIIVFLEYLIRNSSSHHYTYK